jgi:hypothetical protein
MQVFSEVGESRAARKAHEPRPPPYPSPAARRLRAHPARHGFRAGECECSCARRVKPQSPVLVCGKNEVKVAGGNEPGLIGFVPTRLAGMSFGKILDSNDWESIRQVVQCRD